MADVDDIENEGTETGQVILSFLWVFLKAHWEYQLQRLRYPEEMHNLETFQEIYGKVLAIKKWWEGSEDVKNEIGLQVIVSNRFKVFVRSSSFDEIH